MNVILFFVPASGRTINSKRDSASLRDEEESAAQARMASVLQLIYYTIHSLCIRSTSTHLCLYMLLVFYSSWLYVLSKYFWKSLIFKDRSLFEEGLLGLLTNCLKEEFFDF